MKRREFLSSVLAGGAGLAAASVAGCEGPQPAAPQPAAGGAAPAVGGQTVRWRLASSFPRSLDTIFGSADVLAERVRALTGGRFDIKVYPAGELVPALQVLDAVQQGTVQIGQSASYYYIGKNPALAFDTCVPFGMTARQQAAWLLEGGGAALLDKLFAEFNVMSMPAGNTGSQMGGWFKREIGGLADLKGLKMRIPGIGGEVMGKLGVSVQVIAGGDIFPALETGAIDATEWVGPYDDEKLGFHKAANFYYYPGWWEPGPSLSFYINRDAWAALPTEFQEALRSAAAEAATTMQARYDAQNPPALARLIDKGVQMRPFSEDIMVGAREAAFQIYADHSARDPQYREIFEHWDAFRKDSFRWFSAAELAYAQFSYPRG
jgi:TRAP-type mannitol/chloroaromatic compound transport system substrate-binding protein